MPLDPHAKRFLDMVAAAGVSDASNLTPAKMRQGMSRLAQSVDARNISVARIENRYIPASNGPVPVRIYVPAAAEADHSPGLVYFHGGGGVFCDLETHDGLCRMLANESGCRIASVDYRLAPEHPFPAGVEDAYAAANWIFANSSELGIDAQRLGIGGNSTGATLATVVCQLAKQAGGPQFALQVLFCPVTDAKADTASRRAFAERYFLSKGTMAWAHGLYCSAERDSEDPRVSPLRAPDVGDLPPAHIHTAEFDPLRDEGKAYADRLARAGVKVQYTCHPGMIHHFYAMAGAIPYARAVVRTAGADIKRSLNADFGRVR